MAAAPPPADFLHASFKSSNEGVVAEATGNVRAWWKTVGARP
jgi:hypothetical protein